jgi:hypothetical protein
MYRDRFCQKFFFFKIVDNTTYLCEYLSSDVLNHIDMFFRNKEHWCSCVSKTLLVIFITFRVFVLILLIINRFVKFSQNK